MTDRSRLEAVYLTDFDEKYAPPSKVLQVGISGNIVFLAIGKHDETHDTDHFDSTAAIGIDYDALMNTLTFARVMEINAGT